MTAEERVLTVRQPWADLIMAGVKNVENRTWTVPSTLPQWGECPGHGRVILDYPPDGHIADDGPDTETGMGHAAGCYGDCENHGCPVPVPVQADPRYPCGPIEPDGPFPFRLWIHAGKQTDRYAAGGWNALRHAWGATDVGFIVEGRLGVLLGHVTVTGCHHADECRQHRGQFEQIVPEVMEYIDHCSRWAEPDVWHWMLADPEPLDEPIPMKGMLGLWRLPEGVLA